MNGGSAQLAGGRKSAATRSASSGARDGGDGSRVVDASERARTADSAASRRPRHATRQARPPYARGRTNSFILESLLGRRGAVAEARSTSGAATSAIVDVDAGERDALASADQLAEFDVGRRPSKPFEVHSSRNNPRLTPARRPRRSKRPAAPRIRRRTRRRARPRGPFFAEVDAASVAANPRGRAGASGTAQRCSGLSRRAGSRGSRWRGLRRRAHGGRTADAGAVGRRRHWARCAGAVRLTSAPRRVAPARCRWTCRATTRSG